MRYIHLNPIKAGLVEHPKDWEFSSYSEYAGLRSGSLPKLEVVQQQFTSEATYQAFLNPETDLEKSPKDLITTLKVLMLDE